MGYRLRMREIRPEASPLLFWKMDGYSLEEAKARAERLADQHVPVIHVDEPDQLGRRFQWVGYRGIAAIEFKDKPLIPPEKW